MSIVLGAIGIANVVGGLWSSHKASKEQARLAKKQAEAQKKSLKGNFKDYVEMSNRDYIASIKDMNDKYVDAYLSIGNQYKTAMSNLSNEASVRQPEYFESSYYQDMTSELNDQYNIAMQTIYTGEVSNLYTMDTERTYTIVNKYNELERETSVAESGLQANLSAFKYNDISNTFAGIAKLGEIGGQIYQSYTTPNRTSSGIAYTPYNAGGK